MDDRSELNRINPVGIVRYLREWGTSESAICKISGAYGVGYGSMRRYIIDHELINCMEVEMSIDKTKAMELYKQGLSDGAIGEALGCRPNNIWYWRKTHGLASNSNSGRPKEAKHINEQKPVEVTKKPAEHKGVTADIKQDLPDDWKNYFASGKDELKQLQVQIKKLERSILFLRGIAIGAGVFDVDEFLGEIGGDE